MAAKPTLPSVARSRRFQRALGSRLHVLDRDLPAALEHDADALHRSRVASRRLREVLPVFETDALVAVNPIHKSRGRMRRMTQALGGVRELDVALALLDEIVSSHPQHRRAAGIVRGEVQRERAVRYAEMMRTMEDIKPGKLTRELRSLAESGHAPTTGEQLRRLRGRVLGRAAALERTIDEAGSLYAFDRLHRVRIAAKKLRYVLELVQELARVGTKRLVARVRDAQDLLGRLHDLEILAGFVRRVLETPGQRETASAVGQAGLLHAIERETRELHAEYLHRTNMLRTVVAACRDEVAERLH